MATSLPEETPMQLAINEFIEEQKKGLAELLDNLKRSRVEAARIAARESAARIKALNGRVRDVARSGVRLTAVSQGAAQSLIELHADIVTSALTDAAAQIERMAYTESVRDLARMQAEVLQATRQRIVADMARTVTILKGAAGDARRVVAPAKVAAKPSPGRKPPARRKVKAKAKAKAKAKTRTRAKTPAKARKAAGSAGRGRRGR
jgi:hypothetical protein